MKKNIVPFKRSPVDLDFCNEELLLFKRYGEALGGKPTSFDEEVQAHLDGMEANDDKIRASLEKAGFKRGSTQKARLAM
jgi:hypothetical protein